MRSATATALAASLLLTGCFLFEDDPADPVDAGAVTRDAGAGAGCGALTFEGECAGDRLRYCDEGSPAAVDCAARGLACFPSFPDWGADCAAAVGAACGFTDDEGNDFSVLCLGDAPGCVWDADATVCREGFGACSDADVGTCRGSLALFLCQAGQPSFFDCGALGGRCGGATCVDIPEGGVCGAGVAACTAGLRCVDGRCASDGPPPGDARLTIRVTNTFRDPILANHEVHIYRELPRFFLGDRPADAPLPVATARFEDFVATFEDLAPGDYWFDFLWLGELNRFGYHRSERVSLPSGLTEVEVEWMYSADAAAPGAITLFDAARPWGLISVTSTDPVLASAPDGVTLRVDGVSLGTRLRTPGPAAARCGELGDDQRRLIVVPPGTYAVDAVCTVCDPAGSHWWNPRSVTVGPDECVTVELGAHDCTSITPCR